MYFIYLLRCKNHSLYCGYTTDLLRRVYEHCYAKVGAKYTKQNPPVAIAMAWQIDGDLSATLKLEHAIKKLSKPKKEGLVQKPQLDNFIKDIDPAIQPQAFKVKDLQVIWNQIATKKME